MDNGRPTVSYYKYVCLQVRIIYLQAYFTQYMALVILSCLFLCSMLFGQTCRHQSPQVNVIYGDE